MVSRLKYTKQNRLPTLGSVPMRMMLTTGNDCLFPVGIGCGMFVDDEATQSQLSCGRCSFLIAAERRRAMARKPLKSRGKQAWRLYSGVC